jgi:hypothetical protein
MRTISELTPEQLTEAKKSADILLSETYRSYLPGRLLAVVLSRYRDDAAEALGLPVPELPRRAGQVRKVTLDELTTHELHEITHVVLMILTYADTMDDPALPELLRKFRDDLKVQKQERDKAQAAVGAEVAS